MASLACGKNARPTAPLAGSDIPLLSRHLLRVSISLHDAIDDYLDEMKKTVSVDPYLVLVLLVL